MDTARTSNNDARWPFAQGEMAQRVREHDWAATSLGRLETWPASLRITVQLMLSHPFATIVLWGPDLTQIYNDAYRDLMGAKHPAGLGAPTRECWPEVWHINAPIYERVWQGESLVFEDALYPLARSGEVEDVWLSLTYSPVRDEAGRVAGVFITIIETTRRLRAEAALRETQVRQAFLLRLSDALHPLQDAQAIKQQATRLLGEQLGVNRAFYAEVRSDDWFVTKGYERGVLPLPDRPYAARTDGDWIMAAYLGGQRIVFHDSGTDARFSPSQRQAHAALQIPGAVGVPLVKQGTLVAVLAVHSAAPRQWSEAEVAMVAETAERTWTAVERARVEAALRQSEHQLATVVESLPLGVGLLDAQGALLLANQEMRRFMPHGLAPAFDEARHAAGGTDHASRRRGKAATRSEWGFDAVLAKPVTTSALQDTLKQVLQFHGNVATGVLSRGESETLLRLRHGGQRVLLVEDNFVNREVASAVLRAVSLVVETADNGHSALELVSSRPYDLVLMDMQIPMMDGLEATRQVRQRFGAELPIVAMAANAFEEDRQACLDAGMDDFVVNPVEPARLYATLLRWLPMPKAS
jgi:CheY-like chemotaxis protein